MIKTGLEGKVVLVTGANHGIGAATARAFATEGAAVFITYLGPPSADEVVRTIRRDGGRAEAWEADLADPATVPRLFDQVERAFAPVDVLVNNAAVGGPPKDTFIPLEGESQGPLNGILQTITSASHDRHFAVNSRAVALMMAEYARRYVTWGRRWGRIINVSMVGTIPCFLLQHRIYCSVARHERFQFLHGRSRATAQHDDPQPYEPHDETQPKNGP